LDVRGAAEVNQTGSRDEVEDGTVSQKGGAGRRCEGRRVRVLVV